MRSFGVALAALPHCNGRKKNERAEPDDDWTVEQLIHWSLAGYQERANGRLAAHVASYREQCESECDQVMELHREAVRLSKAKS
ncbi:hypothetical protein THAOC_00318, partial [Thalassiosira oceanica]